MNNSLKERSIVLPFLVSPTIVGIDLFYGGDTQQKYFLQWCA